MGEHDWPLFVQCPITAISTSHHFKLSPNFFEQFALASLHSYVETLIVQQDTRRGKPGEIAKEDIVKYKMS